MKHTPGPWTTEDSRWKDCIMASDPSDPGWIKRVAQVSYATDADLKLIAAAPRMLEALRAVLAYGLPGTNPDTMEDMADTARAAIAEAE
jgi:hypothetical protein